MVKSKKSQTKPTVNGVAPPKKPKPRNPWTNTFIQVTEYLLKDYADRV